MNTSVPRQTHLYGVDLLRFIAAFMVLLGHSRNDFFGAYGNLPQVQQGIFTMLFFSFSRLGHEAVLIFFVLSGYLVGGMSMERIKSGTFSVKSYAINRFVRILLPLISAILLFILVSVILSMPINWWTVIGNLFSLQEILVESLVTPFWSLSYEVWFYIIMGALGVLLSKRLNKANRIYKIIAITVLIICIMVFTKLWVQYLVIWYIGAIAYIFAPRVRSNLITFISFVLMMISIVLLQLTSDSVSVSIDKWHFINRPFLEIVFSIFCSLFIQQIVLIKPTHKIPILLDKWGTKLAVFSYTLYLVHRILFLVLFKYFFTQNCGYFNLKYILLYVLFLGIILIVSYMIYYLFERNTATVKKYLKSLKFSRFIIINQ